MNAIQYWELASYIVTVFGLPFAIAVFVVQQRKERNNEEEEEYQLLADAYNRLLSKPTAQPEIKPAMLNVLFVRLRFSA